LGRNSPDWKAAALLVHKIAENYQAAVLYDLPDLFLYAGHMAYHGEHFICPEMRRRAEYYSRITGLPPRENGMKENTGV
jgi:ribonucleoside-triphosphate reductase